jgi:hypothetical protein
VRRLVTISMIAITVGVGRLVAALGIVITVGVRNIPLMADVGLLAHGNS